MRKIIKGNQSEGGALQTKALKEAGAGFKSLTESIDTTTPAGRMMMQMVGSFAEFERAMIKERTKAGLEAARAEGRRWTEAETIRGSTQGRSGERHVRP